MKSFSNLAGFIEALKIGSTIKIVEHKIIDKVSKDTQDTDDTLLPDGIICEIKPDMFGVNINGTEHWFNLNSTEVPFHGSVDFFKKVLIGTFSNNCYVYKNRITFKANSADFAYTFALVQDEKSHCPMCKGSGVQPITCQTFGESAKSISLHDCYHCHGEIVNASVGAEIQADVDYEKSLWCKCRRRHDVYFMADGVDKEIKKHHYRCCKCNKVVQIG